ncbi:uncharacterized protein LOC118493660 [Sander lucioperca]|uniref:uncharacterized protein LOC118493660 n=1 Tax=Sander lucioperca TaxID=283035 RepID=UPI00165391FE|nr:uncharacterized protein LOC118493660 [Sander lucioperca]
MAATGGGSGAPALTPQEDRVAAIIGEELIAGVLPACEGDTNIHPDNVEIEESGTRETQEERERGDPCVASTSTAGDGARTGSAAPRASAAEARQTGRVLTDAVLQSQNEIVNTMMDIVTELRRINDGLTNLCDAIKDLKWPRVVFVHLCFGLWRRHTTFVRHIVQHTACQHNATHLLWAVKQHATSPIQAAPTAFQLPYGPLHH